MDVATSFSRVSTADYEKDDFFLRIVFKNFNLDFVDERKVRDLVLEQLGNENYTGFV